MKLDRLTLLYKSMKSQDIERYRLEYKVGKAVFDIFFFTDGSPFLLLFGVKIENFSFELEVMPGFVINHQLDRDTYKGLCQVLGLEYNPERPFSPWNFFSEFNSRIPQQSSASQKAKPQDVAPYRSFTEEPDKVYFCGWRDNDKRGEKVQNLEKTRALLGEKAYQTCKDKNISSRWTADEKAATEVTLPPWLY
jgi:Family of unknown function (DUF6037)